MPFELRTAPDFRILSQNTNPRWSLGDLLGSPSQASPQVRALRLCFRCPARALKWEPGCFHVSTRVKCLLHCMLAQGALACVEQADGLAMLGKQACL